MTLYLTDDSLLFQLIVLFFLLMLFCPRRICFCFIVPYILWFCFYLSCCSKIACRCDCQTVSIFVVFQSGQKFPADTTVPVVFVPKYPVDHNNEPEPRYNTQCIPVSLLSELRTCRFHYTAGNFIFLEPRIALV